VGRQLAWESWHHVILVVDQAQDRYVSLTVNGRTEDLSSHPLPRSELDGVWQRGQLMEEILANIAPNRSFGDASEDDIFWDNLRISVQMSPPDSRLEPPENEIVASPENAIVAPPENETVTPPENEVVMPPEDEAVISPENVQRLRLMAQFGHGRLNNLAWSPDGLSLAVASSTGIDLYDAGTLAQTAAIRSDAPVFDLFFTSRAGTVVVVTETDAWPSLYLWDLATGARLLQLAGENLVAVDTASHTAVTWTGSEIGYLIVWQDLLTGEIRHRLERQEPPIAYSPAAALLLEAIHAESGPGLGLFDAVSGQFVRQIDDAPLYTTAVAFSPQGHLLAVGGAGAVTLWDVASGELLHALAGHNGRVEYVVFTPDGRFLAASDETTTWLWDAATGALLQTLLATGRPGFSPDGRELTIANPEQVLFYDPATGQLRRALAGYSHPVTDLAFSPDGQLLAATGGNGQVIRLWDVATHQLLRTIEGDEFLAAVAFSPDGQTLAWGGSGPLYQVQPYDLSAHRRLETLPARFSGGVYKIVFSPDGELMAVTDWNGRGQVWQVATLERLFNQPAHFHIAFHPAGQLLAVEQNDFNGRSSVQIWDRPTWQRLRTWPIAGHIYGFNPEGYLLASQNCCAEGHTRAGLLNVETGQFSHAIEGVGGQAVLSPNGRLLVGSSAYNSRNAILFWDVHSGQQLHQLEGHTDSFTVAFSPDGRWLATGSRDGTVRLWGLNE
jgi:WD40 repeat protein